MERFRPIMMTTMAALMGAMPIALGFGADGASRRPLGLVVVGGLIVSQFITLYVTPAIYLYLEEFQEKVLDRVNFCAPAEARLPDRRVRLSRCSKNMEINRCGRVCPDSHFLACGVAPMGGGHWLRGRPQL